VAPENTIDAFARALELGAGGLETDAWLSGDGQVVLVHRSHVRRGLRRLAVARTGVAGLAAVGVPRLTDLYRELGTAFELSIDIKTPVVARPVLAVAEAAGALGRLWVCSPDLAVLADLRAAIVDDDGARPHLVHSRARRHLPEPLERHAAALAADGITAMNLHHTEWTAGLVALFHRFGLKALAWDAQEVRYIRAMVRMGVDGIYSDHVDRLVRTVADPPARRCGR